MSVSVTPIFLVTHVGLQNMVPYWSEYWKRRKRWKVMMLRRPREEQ